MNESIENLRAKFLKWKEAFKSKGLKADLKKAKMMVSGFESAKLIHELRVARMTNSVMCTKHGTWMQVTCAKTKKVTATPVKDFVYKPCVKKIVEIR